MADGNNAFSVKILTRIGEVAAADWDACAGPDNPFVRHAFLQALEDSGSVGRRTGWIPMHLALYQIDGRLRGAVPFYLKSHSYGEYVFDHAWANAYDQAGGSYYPKLQAAVPFTPVTGSRLLLHPDAPAMAGRALIEAMEQVARRHDVSSVHVTFPTRAEWDLLGEAGWLQRTGLQYHWENAGYRGFDDFLGALNSRRRKAVRKERRAVADSGIRLTTLTGGDIAPRHWDAFHRFYQDTTDRKWGSAYLTRAFFHRLGEIMADHVVLVMAEDDGTLVGGALNLLGTDTLYGRNWGCLGDYRFLHFEACYYRAIDFAIERGLKRVEAGAQGEHKIQRGYLPTHTYSAHWLRDASFRRAVAGYLVRERAAVDQEIAALMAQSPFRQTEDKENEAGMPTGAPQPPRTCS